MRRFLFSSSCIMYGVSDAPEVDETSPLDPEPSTHDRRSMPSAPSPAGERRFLARLPAQRHRLRSIATHAVRHGSQRSVGAAVADHRIVVQGDGQPWRPVVHVEDVSRAFAAVLAAPEADVHNQAFNTGSDSLNMRVIDLAKAAARRSRRDD